MSLSAALIWKAVSETKLLKMKAVWFPVLGFMLILRMTLTPLS